MSENVKPVAWALYENGDFFDAVSADEFDVDAWCIRKPYRTAEPLYLSPVPPVVTDEMVDHAVAVYMHTTSALTPDEYRGMQPDNYNMMWCGLKEVLTAALRPERGEGNDDA